jgi:hypothetical protein
MLLFQFLLLLFLIVVDVVVFVFVVDVVAFEKHQQQHENHLQKNLYFISLSLVLSHRLMHACSF